MNWLKIAGVIALTATSAGALAESQVEGVPDPVLPEAQTLALQTDSYRRMTVAVQLNGQGPFRFMVDTGAQATVLSHLVADQLQLGPRATATLVGMASTRQVQTAQIAEIAFGNHSAYDARAALVDGVNIGGADGILGLDSLQDRRVLLDFANREMLIGHASERASSRGFDIVVRARSRNGQLIIASAEIDGVRTAVMVDTGAQGSIGNAALQTRLRRARENVSAEMTDINGVQTTGTSRMIRKLDFGSAQINNLVITFADSPTFAALDLVDEPALILGMNELRLFQRVAIDFPSRRVLFDLPPGARLPDAAAFGGLAGR
ncbi:MAG: retroviral-like aspartic protease family protein [Alteraurantiacibacter sp.]